MIDNARSKPPPKKPSGNEIIQVSEHTAVYQLIEKLAVHEQKVALVLDSGNPITLVGIRNVIDLIADRQDIGALQVRDIKASPIVIVQPNESREQIYKRLCYEEATYAIVLDAHGEPCQVLSQNQLLQELRGNVEGSDEPVSQIMSPNVIVLPAEESVNTALQVMSDNRIGNIVVCEKGNRPVLFSVWDAIRFLNRRLPLTTPLRDAGLSTTYCVGLQDSQRTVLKAFRMHSLASVLVLDHSDELAGILSYRNILKQLPANPSEPAQSDESSSTPRIETRPAYDRLQYILEISPASIYVLRPTQQKSAAFRVTMISPSITHITGYTPAEWIARKLLWSENLHPADRELALQRQQKLLNEGSLAHQYRFRHKNGSYRWIHDQLSLIRHPNGEVLEVIGSWMDITRIRETEQALRESEKESRTIFMTAPECILKLGREGKILAVNYAGLELLQVYSAEQLQGRLYFDLVPANDHDRVYELNEQVFQNRSGTLEHQVRGINGRLRWVETRAVPMLNEQHQVTACLCISRDITEQRAAEECLRKLSMAVEHNPCAIMITDSEGKIEYVNPKFTAITEYEISDLRGKNPKVLDSGQIPRETFQELWATIRSGKEWHGELLNRKKSGILFWSKQSIAPVFDASGRITHFVSIQEDFSESRKQAEQLNFYARFDPLTHLVNRYEFEQRITRLLKSSSDPDHSHVLCYLDLDQFKVINDSCGHVAGDELLRQVADLLGRTVRRQDLVARLGGDEFAIFMENCPINQGCATAERILEQFRQFRFLWGNLSYGVGVSIGVVPVSFSDKQLNDLLKKADSACYAAKEAGRNRVRVYREEIPSGPSPSNEMEYAWTIQRNLESDRFQLYIQKVEALQNNPNARCHFEVLLRMFDLNDQFIPPGAFLPVAERYDLIGRIDQWVLQEVMNWLQQPHGNGSQSTLFVNLSAYSLSNPQFLDWMLSELERRNLDCTNLGFEISETAVISNLSKACRLIDGLKSQGALFALDGFGSGLSSFAYLKNLDVDFLKIDGSFVTDILNDPIDLELVASINRIGHVMGKKTVAEHVESMEIKSKLIEIGVDFVQGFAIDAPQRLDSIRDE